MNAEIDIDSEENSKAHIFVGSLVIIILMVALISWLFSRPKESPPPNQETTEMIAKSLEPQVTLGFKKWTEFSQEGKEVIQWTGESSEIIYIEYMPSTVSHSAYLFGAPNATYPLYQVWARTENGRIFSVRSFVIPEANKLSEFSLNPLSASDAEERLLGVLIRSKKDDLIKKYKFKVKAA